MINVLNFVLNRIKFVKDLYSIAYLYSTVNLYSTANHFSFHFFLSPGVSLGSHFFSLFFGPFLLFGRFGGPLGLMFRWAFLWWAFGAYFLLGFLLHGLLGLVFLGLFLIGFWVRICKNEYQQLVIKLPIDPCKASHQWNIIFI